jgi:hypothetical protein
VIGANKVVSAERRGVAFEIIAPHSVHTILQHGRDSQAGFSSAEVNRASAQMSD